MKKGKDAIERSKMVCISGNFHLGHEPRKIRSLRMKKTAKKNLEKQKMEDKSLIDSGFPGFEYPYNQVQCTVEWF